MAYQGAQKVQKVMVQPINLIFRYLQNRSRIQVWLYEQTNLRIEGCIISKKELTSSSTSVTPTSVTPTSLNKNEKLGSGTGRKAALQQQLKGFDEYMNLVLDEAEEVHMKTKARKTLGRILLKGDNITLIQQIGGATID